MKKVIFLLCMATSLSTYAQTQRDRFLELLMPFKKIEKFSTVGSYEMLQNAGEYIDNQLAWEFLWQKNKFMKPEETFCQPVGWFVQDKIAVLIFFTGQKDNTLAYFVSFQTYDIKSAKMIDELRNVASFGVNDRGYPVCNMNLGSFDNLSRLTFTTLTSVYAKETVLKFDIAKNGKIKAVK